MRYGQFPARFTGVRVFFGGANSTVGGDCGIQRSSDCTGVKLVLEDATDTIQDVTTA
jgi:hypothetical protein